MFIPKNYDSGKLKKIACADSTTIAKGDAMIDNGSGYLTTGGSGTAVEVTHVAMEGVTTTSAGQLVTMIRARGVVFEADTDANPAQTDVGTYVDLATKSTVNPDASTNNIFYIESIKGAVGDKKIVGRFTEGVPNS